MDIEKLMNKYFVVNKDACRRLVEAGSGIDPEAIIKDHAAMEQIGKGRTVRTTGTGSMLMAADSGKVKGCGSDYNLDKDLEEGKPNAKQATKQFMMKAGIKDIVENL